MLALYNAAQETTTTSDATATATEAAGHGPYAAGEAHGGNVNVVKALAAVTATATAEQATATLVTDSSDDWVTAASPRNTTMYSNSFSTDPNDDDSSDMSGDDSEANTSDGVTVIETGSAKQSSKGVPGWAIGLTIVLILGSFGGVATLLYLKHRKSAQDDNSTEKAGKPSKKEPEDALSSYKAFWELKRRSAGSFISADASPEALASDLNNSLSRPVSHSSNASLPIYEPQDSRAPEFTIASPVNTPLNEEAPPRGFLYQ
ncbi:protein of unknown function [Taphrina deformans PYCC 5710]|uniref:Uncharacterized protein n=1 Tax=Taphrina deformans (strain PYCC 5710 / ATCC 11124 / CBS 356.35 / IMI 108563 / JCM 9778 / NBRC 8474) TaxID=1097556 RepID=R4X8G0_TAPDE|nr:protein of unknown function [Taphrina deformans PYCC 5710]|eukprot:CCG81581.1 protein of unknown function [Taphrina deformans PYCC 5710]